MANGSVGLITLVFAFSSLGEASAASESAPLAGRVEQSSGASADGALPGVMAPVDRLNSGADLDAAANALKTCIEKHRLNEKIEREKKLAEKETKEGGEPGFDGGSNDGPAARVVKTEFWDRPVGINLDCACNNGPKLLAAGHFQAAADAFKQYGQQVLVAFANEEGPDYATALTWEGYANYKLGRTDEARKLWLKAVKIYAENETRQDIIQWIYNRLGAVAKGAIE